MKGQKDFNLNLRVYQAERDIFRSKGLVLGICIIERGQGLNRESQSFRTYSFKFERSILEFKDGCMVRVQQNVSTKALQF